MDIEKTDLNSSAFAIVVDLEALQEMAILRIEEQKLLSALSDEEIEKYIYEFEATGKMCGKGRSIGTYHTMQKELIRRKTQSMKRNEKGEIV
jgi:hypothetical protein